MIRHLCLVRLIIMLLLGLSVSSAWANATLEIRGLKGELESNVEAFITTLRPRDYRNPVKLRQVADVQIRTALQALGYYEPEIRYQANAAARDQFEVIATVNPGEPVRIRERRVLIKGEGSADINFLRLLEDSPVQNNAVLHHGQYEALKSSLQGLALRRGYFDAKFDVNRLEVSPPQRLAFVVLEFNTGPRYKFGQTSFEGSQIRESRLETMVPYQPGDYYHADTLGELNLDLNAAGWFSSVFVHTDLENEEDLEIPIKVSVSPDVTDRVETGVGWSTDVGARVQLNWTKPWINDLGHSLNTRLMVSKPEQSIESYYKVPLDDAANQYYNVGAVYKGVNRRDTKSKEFSLGIERYRIFSSGLQRTVFVRYLHEDYTQGSEEGLTNLILPGISFTRTRSKGGLFPYWGDKQFISTELSSQAWFSDENFIRLVGESNWIRGDNENNRGILRLNGGGILSKQLVEVPPSLRFFAGGSNSIRGYGYEEISPRDENGKQTGGRYMLTTSLEYQRRVKGNWWGATFVDYGDAWNETFEGKTGVGFGVRWASPVGPVSFDLAWGLAKPKGERFQLHFSIGPEL